MKKSLLLSVATFCSVAFLSTGCMSSMNMGSSDAKTVATGSAGGANGQNVNKGLERCTSSLGTLAIYEEKNSSWYEYLTRQYKLTSTVPVIRLLAQQSNCFVVVERGRAMNQMMQERDLAKSGELRTNSNFGKGQMVAADYTVTPSITFSEQGTSGIGGAVGAIFGSVAGAVAGGFKTSDASTILTLIENRSGVQLAAAEGSARNTDLFGMGGLFGGSAGGALGGYSRTPEGKVIVAAFTDSMNNLIRAVKNYKAQSVSGGLGAGGQLGVQGATRASFQGVMTQRNYSSSRKVYDYVIISKDRSKTYTFSSSKKIPYKNDLVQFSLNGNNVDPNSLIRIESRYYQKHWK